MTLTRTDLITERALNRCERVPAPFGWVILIALLVVAFFCRWTYDEIVEDFT